MSVTFVRPEVEAKRASWKLVRDAVAGSEAVKAGGYVIPVNPHDTSDANRKRNEARVEGAFYFNATGRTLPALVGIAYGKWPEVQLPSDLEFLLQDVDGSGVGLINQSQATVSDVLQTGRAGLLVDYPQSGRATSKADAEALALRPTIALYAAESIINWRTQRVGAQNLLTLVVLQETYEEWGDFELEVATQYRVLRLDEGRYVQEVWREARKGQWEVAESHEPRDGSGQPWSEIPFTFVGATNNDSTPDNPPLYDLADANIAHFRNSADHEEALFFAGQAQFWVSGATDEWVETLQKSGAYVGSRAIMPVPDGGQMGIVQAQAVSALSEEMKHKVELMAQLGARLIAPGQATRTATEAAADDKTSNSVLSIVCDNVSDAYRTALRWVAKFARVTHGAGELDFSISTEFSGVQFDAAQMAQVLALVQAGYMPMSALWTYLRANGLIDADKSDDEIQEELAALGWDEPEIAIPQAGPATT